MARIAVIYCKRIKDYSCIACAKCYKAMAETKFGVPVILGTHNA